MPVKYMVFGLHGTFDSSMLGPALEVAWTESAALGGLTVEVWRYEGEAEGIIYASVKSPATA